QVVPGELAAVLELAPVAAPLVGGEQRRVVLDHRGDAAAFERGPEHRRHDQTALAVDRVLEGSVEVHARSTWGSSAGKVSPGAPHSSLSSHPKPLSSTTQR